MSKQQHLNRLAKQDEAAGTGPADDAAYFEQHPDCRFRMRLASQYEVATAEAIGKPMPGGWNFLWALVHQIAPGIRQRLIVVAPALLDSTEANARRLFEEAADIDASVSLLQEQLRALSRRLKC
jgi:hypothetical protein